MLPRASIAMAFPLLGACAVSTASRPADDVASGFRVLPDVGVSQAPRERVDASWKQRLAQPYVFIEAEAPRRDFGPLLERVFAESEAQRIQVTGAPFGLFELQSDPSRAIRIRACLPVEDLAPVAPPLRFDSVSSETVAYAYIAGSYAEVDDAHAALIDWMSAFDWTPSGPAREIYLVDPALVSDPQDLVTELQIPVASLR